MYIDDCRQNTAPISAYIQQYRGGSDCRAAAGPRMTVEYGLGCESACSMLNIFRGKQLGSASDHFSDGGILWKRKAVGGGGGLRGPPQEHGSCSLFSSKEKILRVCEHSAGGAHCIPSSSVYCLKVRARAMPALTCACSRRKLFCFSSWCIFSVLSGLPRPRVRGRYLSPGMRERGGSLLTQRNEFVRPQSFVYFFVLEAPPPPAPSFSLLHRLLLRAPSCARRASFPPSSRPSLLLLGGDHHGGAVLFSGAIHSADPSHDVQGAPERGRSLRYLELGIHRQ